MYKITKTKGGSRPIQIDSFPTIDEARKELANILRRICEQTDTVFFFGTQGDIDDELAFVDNEETRESWGDRRVDRHAGALRNAKAPCALDTNGYDVIDIANDCFSYDDETYSIE